MHLLVIKPSSLGDIVHGLQVVAALKRQKPDVYVTWLVRDCFQDIVTACTCVDEVLVFKRNGGLCEQLGLIRKLRARRYDYVWDMQGLLRSALWTWLSRAGVKVGRDDAREGARYFYDVRVKSKKNYPHAVERLLPFLDTLGCEPNIEPLPLRELPALNWPENFTDKKRVIAVFPHSRRAEKNWPYFQELAEKLCHRGAHIVWCGNESCATRHANIWDLTHKTTLSEMLALIHKVGRVVVNDSGPMHIAVALGVPTVALFGPTEPEKYGPYPPKGHVVLCAPEGNLKNLTVEIVLSRLL